MSILHHVFLTYFSDAHAYSQDVATNPAATNPAATNPVDTDLMDTDPMDIDPIATGSLDTDPIASDSIATDPVDTNPVPTSSSNDLKFPVTIVNGKMKLNPPVDQRSSLQGRSA